MKLWVFILNINLPELSELRLTEIENEAVSALLKRLHDLDAATKAQQDASSTLAVTRALFDEMILRFLSKTNILGIMAAVIVNKHFESDIV